MSKLIIRPTEDGSVTFYNDDVKDIYHSTSGAIEESLEKYVKGAKVKDGFNILDICFGVGYNTLCAIHFHKNLKITALELDPEIISKCEIIPIPKDYKENYEIIKKVAKENYYKDDNYEIKLIVGDALKTIKELDEKFDAVLLDPFSPKKAPELWSREFFSDIKKLMKKGAIMSTYSCARMVRDNLIAAGFTIKDGPVVGRRAPGTIAVNN